MIDREKVISALKHMEEVAYGWNLNGKVIGIPVEEFEDICYDAATMLKAQEPRVMTLEEIPDAVFGWMEMFGQIIPCVLEDVYADDTVGFANIEDGHDYVCASDYGKTWRCWTSRPTDAQREAVPWQDA